MNKQLTMPLFSIEDLQNEMDRQLMHFFITKKKYVNAFKTLQKFTDIFTIVDGQVYLSVNLDKVFKLYSYYTFNTNFIIIGSIGDDIGDEIFLEAFINLMDKLMKCDYNYWRIINTKKCGNGIYMPFHQIKFYYNEWVKINDDKKMETFDQVIYRIFGKNIEFLLYSVKVQSEKLKQMIKEQYDYDRMEYEAESYMTGEY